MKNINLSNFFKPTNYLLLLATLVALAAGYYFLIALPAHNREKIELERQRAEAEEKQRQLQEQSAELQERLRMADQDRLADEQVKREKERLKGLAAEYAERQAREERLASEEMERQKRLQAEARERQAQQERERQRLNDELRQKDLYFDCMEAAEKKYWDFVKLNGTEDPNNPGVWRASQGVWQEARLRKQAALDECERLYRLIKE